MMFKAATVVIALASLALVTGAQSRSAHPHGRRPTPHGEDAGAYDPTRRSGAIYSSGGINRDSINNSSGLLGNSNVGGNGGGDTGGNTSGNR